LVFATIVTAIRLANKIASCFKRHGDSVGLLVPNIECSRNASIANLIWPPTGNVVIDPLSKVHLRYSRCVGRALWRLMSCQMPRMITNFAKRQG
jgi:hypothetical protein